MKRTIIYAAIAAILVLTFILQESLDSGKNTIKISSLPGDLEKIVLEGNGKKLELYPEAPKAAEAANAANPVDDENKDSGASSKENDYSNWKVGEEAFPADPVKIANLVSVAESLDRADVISSREGYKKFGLDEKNERVLRFFSGVEEVLVLRLGSKASSGAAVYGRIQDRKEVVMLPQALSDKFSVYSEDFREKQMASFARDSIDRMEITSTGQEKVLLSKKVIEKPEEPKESGDVESGDLAPGGGDTKAEALWTAETAGGEKIEAADEGSFRNLLTELSDLRAEGFPESDPQGEPFADLIVYRNGGERAVVSLWPPDADGNYPARVSTNRYSFTIPKWRARRLLLGLDRYFEAFEENES